MTLQQIVDFCISWVPTILFGVIVLWAALVGLIRGFRKSLILLINAAISALILLIIYLIMVNSKGIDASIVNLANKILPATGMGTVQELFDVSPECKSLTEILLEGLPKTMNLGDGMALVMAENGAYLGAVVNSVYHIILAIICGLFYPFVVFIFYIVYLCTFREGKYKKRKRKAHEEDPENNPPYRKRRLFGSLVGMARGSVVGLVWLSFIGSILFIAVGDNGKNNDVDVDFGSDEINEYYDIYESVASYGDKGIYAVLNVLHDRNDVPYYLFIADIVLSGSYKDVENKVNAEIVYRKEFAAYTKFARETIELLSKYGGEYLGDIVAGDTGDTDMLVMLQDIFSQDGFQDDFDRLIDDFESDTFIINFALSFVDSFARNIDKQEFIETMNPDTAELLKILLTGEDAITVSNIVSKDDAKLLLNTVIEVVASGAVSSDTADVMASVSLVKDLLPNLTKLSIFTDEAKRDKGNKVLSHVYAYLAANIDNSDDSIEEVSKKLSAQAGSEIDNVEWMSEIEMLLNRAPDVLEIYENSYDAEKEEIDILHILDADNPHALENEQALDNIINDLCDSKLLGVVLSMTFIENAIVEGLSSIVEDFAMPSDLQYTRKYDEAGNVVEDGELYSVLTALKAMMKNGLGDVVDSMSEAEGENSTGMIKDLVDLLLIEDSGECALDKLVESKLLTYTLSQVVLGLDLGEGLTIIVPEESLDTTSDVNAAGEPIKIIKKDELKSIVSSIGNVLPEEEGEEMIDIKNIISKKDEILESNILHATIISFLVNSFTVEEGEDEMIIIPAAYKNDATEDRLRNYFTQTVWYQTKEVSKVLDAIDMLLGITTSDEPFDLENIDSDAILENVTTLTDDADGIASTPETKLDICYQSIIIQGTLAKQVDNVLSEDFVDAEVKVLAKETETGYYKAKEVAALIDAINVLELDFNNLDTDTITNLISELNDQADSKYGEDVTKLDVCFESVIIKGVLTKQVDNVLTDELIDTTIRNSTKVDNFYTSSEIGALLDGVEVLNLDFNNIEMDTIKDSVLSLNDDADPSDSKDETKLDICFGSVIFQGILTKQLDNALTDELVDTDLRDSTKENNLYTSAEVGSLIGALNALDIDFTNMDTSAISNVINELNDDADPSDSSDATKLDVCYESVIFRGVVTLQIDNVMTDDLVNQALRDSTKVDDLYTAKELVSLLDAIEIIGIDYNNMDFDNIQDIVLSLADDADPSDSSDETKLDICYESILFQGIVAMQLDNVLTTDLLTADNKNRITVEYLSTSARIYLKDDIAAVINSINSLGIEDISNLDLDNVTILKEDINTIASSRIIRAILDKNLEDSATSAAGSTALFILPNRARDYEAGEYTYLSEAEVKNLLSVLWDELGTDAGSGKKTISMSVDLSELSINSGNIDDFTSSYIVLSTISDKLASYLYIPASAKDTASDALSTDIKAEELSKFITAVEAFQPGGITINVNFSTENLSLTRAKMAIVTASEIMHYAVSKQIVDNIAGIPTEAFATGTASSENPLITALEINNLVMALQDIIGGRSTSNDDPAIEINDININGSDMTITKAKINSIMNTNRSYIVHNMITDTITETLGVVPQAAYLDAEFKYINASEVTAIIDLVGTGSGDNKGISIGGSNSFDFSEINIDAELIANTNVLRYKVSQELFGVSGTSIFIPAGVKNIVNVVGATGTHYWINDGEIEAFLDGVASITGGSLDVTSIDISFPEEKETVAESAILRATITDKLSFQSGGSSIAILADAADKDSYATEEMPIIGKDEMTRLLNAIEIILGSGSFEVELDIAYIASLTEEAVYTITTSSIMKNVLTNMIAAVGFNVMATTQASVQIYNGTALEDYALVSTAIPGYYGLANDVLVTADYSVYAVETGTTTTINVWVEQKTLQAYIAIVKSNA